MWILALALALPSPTEAKRPRQDPQAAAYAAVDQGMVQMAETMRAQAQAAPGNSAVLLQWGGVLNAAAQSGSLARGAVPADHLDAYFQAVGAAKGDDPQFGLLLGMSAEIALAAGRNDQALALAERALDTHPTSSALRAWLAVTPDPTAGGARCRAAADAAASDIQRFDTIGACLAAVGDGWATADERAWYQAELGRRQASQAAHDAALQQQAAAQAAAMQAARPAPAIPAPSASTSSKPAGPQRVSVSMHIDCPEKVRIFQGRSPSSGGTYGWESSNSTRSLSMDEGDVLCIADDRDHIGSCWTASGSSVSLDVQCGGFRQR
ncbi:MAG: hypothetical protein H6742_03685 [Alphaproteobacteria bacterium]|nr:hypothetical protein [Alphaproteobacteria bacterium]